MMEYLNGDFDIYINNYCNLSCKNCSVLDYNGKVTISTLKLNDVKEILSNLEKHNLKLRMLTIAGGEPTLHKQFKEIVEYSITKNKHYDKLRLVTNGLNFTSDVIEICKNFDIIKITEYINLGPIEKKLRSSLVFDILSQNSKVEFFPIKTFQIYGTESHSNPSKAQEGFIQENNNLFTKELNFERCWQKEECLALTKEGIYRCVITMNERIEVVEWDNAIEVNNDVPLSRCSTCYWYPKQEKWDTLNKKKDIRNFNRGISLIEKHSS